MPEQTIDYSAELRAILEQPLTPEIINTYADHAIQLLIELVSRVSIDYSDKVPDAHETQAKIEDAAFSYFRLADIGGVLGQLSLKSAEINFLDTVISTANSTNTVIIPPTSGQAGIQHPGRKPYESPRILPRLKTILYLLENEFDIDLHDPGNVILNPGNVESGMVRSTGYYYLEVPPMNRSLLVCDETDNVTYIFDNEKLQEYSLTGDKLKEFTKFQIDSLFVKYPDMGRRIRYSGNFVDDITLAMRDLDAYDKAPIVRPRRSYLLPKAPAGYLSRKGIADVFHLDSYTVSDAIDAVQDNLGPVQMHLYGPNSALSYSPDQQGIIVETLDRAGYLVDDAPPTHLNVREMSEFFGVSRNTIDNAVSELRQELGIVHKFRYGVQRTEGFDPWQQNIIRSYLLEKDYLVPRAPETVLSVTGMVKLFGVSYENVLREINENSAAIGNINKYSFVGMRKPGFDPWQQNIIYDGLYSKRLVAPKATDDIWSKKRMETEWGVYQSTLWRVIAQSEADLGEVKYYKFAGVITKGYGVSQREIIKQRLIDRGIIKTDI